MISFDFEYILPETMDELLDCVKALNNEGISYVYYAGGTELVTSFRQGKVSPGAVVDLKGLPEMTSITETDDEVIIGACVSLNRIVEHVALSRLKQSIEPIADHTVRNALTIGGNICGRLPYREAVLPLIGLDAEVVIASPNGSKRVKLSEVFDKRLLLEKDAFLFQIIVKKVPVKWQFAERITSTVEVDYPVIHLVAICTDEMVTLAISGYASFPVFWRIPVLTFEKWEDPKSEIVSQFFDHAKSDMRSDKTYRQHLLEHLVDKMLREVAK
ncbi:MAG TPA: xanthine dehydrogenase [Clostridiales bacterium UBA8960]|jgi:CO/xanthine dehydrogenase FAD-binding subunit|nr:xanthine dehydrogenase [Clostridiales bacterium UBA8960]